MATGMQTREGDGRLEVVAAEAAFEAGEGRQVADASVRDALFARRGAVCGRRFAVGDGHIA